MDGENLPRTDEVKDGGYPPLAESPAPGGEASATGFPADWNVVKDEHGNVTVSPPAAADGQCGQDVVIGPGSIGPAGVVTEAPSTRPYPLLGRILCQVCKRPTNSEQQVDLVDTPLLITFNNQPRAVMCYECYVGGIFAAARIGLAEKLAREVPVPPGG